MSSSDIANLVEIGAFQQAYERLRIELDRRPDSTELMWQSLVLSRKVRSKAIDLASNKATDGSAEAMQLEGLLRKIIQINGEDLYGRIANHALREEYLPPQGSQWKEIIPFAATFNAYEESGGNEVLADIGKGKARPVGDCTLTELRAALFFEFRRYRHFGQGPDANAMVHIEALVEEIRIRLQNGEHPS